MSQQTQHRRQPSFQDFHLPAWVVAISAISATGKSLALLSLAAVIFYIFDLSVLSQSPNALFPFAILGSFSLLCWGIFSFSAVRGLRGFGGRWRSVSAASQAGLSVGLACALAVVHPLIPVGIVATGVLTVVFYRVSKTPLIQGDRWDHSEAELAAVLIGRPDTLTTNASAHSLEEISKWLGLAVSIALVSWLAASEVVTISAVPAIFLLTSWAGFSIHSWLHIYLENAALVQTVSIVDTIALPPIADEDEPPLLEVRDLQITCTYRQRMLLEVQIFTLENDVVTGLTGSSGSGKSLMMKSLSDPFLLQHAQVSGQVSINGTSHWRHSAVRRSVDLVYVSSRPQLQPVSMAANITVSLASDAEALARKTLAKFHIFGREADEILACPSPDMLTETQIQIIALVRAFELRPRILLLDQPTMYLSQKHIAVLAQRIVLAKNEGTATVVISDDRSIQNLFDREVVLSDGSIAENGSYQEIQARRQKGWQRLELTLNSGAEDRLHNWLKTQFTRAGDEKNRRQVCLTSSALLGLTKTSGDVAHDQCRFEFQNAAGACKLVMMDAGKAISPTDLSQAKEHVLQYSTDPLDQPLVSLVRQTGTIDQQSDSLEDGFARKLMVSVPTYDPRAV
jgi:ABC-type multidrug transport system fused ATPase/permease subunit